MEAWGGFVTTEYVARIDKMFKRARIWFPTLLLLTFDSLLDEKSSLIECLIQTIVYVICYRLCLNLSNRINSWTVQLVRTSLRKNFFVTRMLSQFGVE